MLRVIEGGVAARERRRRWLGTAVVAAVAVLVIAVLVARGGPAPTIEAPAADVAVATVTIEPGETLWDVAVAHAPAGTDPRAYLERIQRVNGVDTTVRPWTVVLLPDGDG